MLNFLCCYMPILSSRGKNVCPLRPKEDFWHFFSKSAYNDLGIIDVASGRTREDTHSMHCGRIRFLVFEMSLVFIPSPCLPFSDPSTRVKSHILMYDLQKYLCDVPTTNEGERVFQHEHNERFLCSSHLN